jgi:hypothetical protein
LNTDFLTFWKNRSTLKVNKKIFVFLFCLCISFFFWLQINFSKKQIETLSVNIKFINLPKPLYEKSKQTQVVYIEAEADGYDMLKYETVEIPVDFKKMKKTTSSNYYYTPNSSFKTISKQLGAHYKLIRIVSDTLYLH